MDDDENRNNFMRREQHYVHLQPDILVPEVRNVENRQYRRERSASPGGPAGANVFVNPSPPPPPPRPPPRVSGGPSRSPSPPRNPRRHSREPPAIYRARRHSHRRASPEPVRINIQRPQTPDVTFLAQHYFESGGGIGDLEYLRQRFGTGRERKKITKLRKHRKPEDGPVVLGFFCWRKGMRVDDDRKIIFRFNKHKDDGDTWLIDRMKNSYRTRLNRSLIFPLRTIGFAKYIRMQKIEKRWRVTAQQTVEKYKDSSSISRFVYRLRYPFTNRTIRPWMKTLETLIEQAEGECIMLVELFEVPNTETIYWLLYIAIFLCTGGGIAYAVVRKDVATGISLSGYLVACMALILALVSAGEFIGLQRPDSYSWAYDIVDGEEAWEISNLEEEAWKTYNTHMNDQP